MKNGWFLLFHKNSFIGKDVMKPFMGFRVAVYALFFAAIWGCGGGGPPTRTVTGSVTLNGKPLANAEVFLEGLKKPGEQITDLGMWPAATGADGTFELKDSKIKPGLYKVKIIKYVDDKGNVPDSQDFGQLKRAGKLKNMIPANYNEESDLKADVKDAPSTNLPAFDLKTR